MSVPIRCIRCDQILDPAKVVDLELDQRINAYHDFGGVPESHSQGWFTFGAACANKERNAAKAKLDTGTAPSCGKAE